MRLALVCLRTAEVLPELLILDEPINNPDLRSQEELTGVLAGYQGALLLVSHDEEFAV
jgi:ATPase subunit of ABC transporter with duplicated ATPase domains